MDVEYPGFGTIIVDGTRYDHDGVIESGEVRPRNKGPSKAAKARFGHTPLSAAEDLPWSGPRLVIGSGHSARLPIMDDVRAAAAKRGVTLEVMPTAAACALLRTLEGSEVNAVLHVTC